MLQNRPPIIVILGHVDHGKTTLLDALRKTNVAAREAGGITQHIRSFQLAIGNSQFLTFIDTPGHAAFSHLRSRGSQLADIAILVISAVDGVMPQTLESLEFIHSAKLPFVVALTKSDLPDANPDRVKTQLTEHSVVVEDFGGQIPCVLISAKTGSGLPALLELLDLLASLNPPQADPAGPLEAIVLESRFDPKKGPLATVVVKNGTLVVGQSLPLGKVKALTNSDGQSVPSALPSTPVEIFGFSSVPPAGYLISPQSMPTVTSTSSNLKKTAAGQVDIILKADVTGSLEAILNSLPPEINVVQASTGDVTESDILLAKNSKLQIVAFNVRIPGSVAKLAEIEKITIRTYSIIYQLFEELDLLLHPAPTEVITGVAQILAEFKMDAVRVAGCKCTSGLIARGNTLRLERGGQAIGQTRVKSLRLGKTETDSVKAGVEFGAIFSPNIDFKIGDSIIACSIHGQT